MTYSFVLVEEICVETVDKLYCPVIWGNIRGMEEIFWISSLQILTTLHQCGSCDFRTWLSCWIKWVSHNTDVKKYWLAFVTPERMSFTTAVMNTVMPISLRHQIREKMFYTKWILVMTSSAKYVIAGNFKVIYAT